MAYNTITLKTRTAPLLQEAQAAAALSPGYLIYRNSSNKFAKHATASGRALPMFALENEVFGNDLTTAYATDDNVLAAVFTTGEEVYAKVAASAAAIVVGDFLESAGDGTLRILSAGDIADLTGTLTGTVNGSLADIAATAAATVGGATPTAAQVDTGIALAVSTIVTGTNEQLKEIQAKVNALLPAGTQRAICIALEAVDNSAGVTEAFIRVQVL